MPSIEKTHEHISSIVKDKYEASLIKTPPSSKAYRDNYDRIFSKKQKAPGKQ